MSGFAESKFKVGDRVRYGDDYCLDGIGTITEDNAECGWFVEVETRHRDKAFFDGGTTRIFEECNLELVPVAPATGTLTIQPGRYYKTRDGRKVGPAEPNEDDAVYPWNVPHNHFYGYSADGKSCLYRDEDDLIAEWVDEPAVAPATAKFKVGDAVKFRDDYPTRAAGKYATVVAVNVWGEDGIQVDQGGKYGVSTEASKDLRLVAPATSGNVIVALIENGQPKPSVRPYVHDARAGAEREAARLAGKHPGKEFGVYELVATKREAKVYDFEWQRLAAEGKDGRASAALADVSGLAKSDAHDAVMAWLRAESIPHRWLLAA